MRGKSVENNAGVIFYICGVIEVRTLGQGSGSASVISLDARVLATYIFLTSNIGQSKKRCGVATDF